MSRSHIRVPRIHGSVLAAFSMAVILAACQDQRPAVSLDEAKEITAGFSGSFTPPPRTINDILAVIEQGQVFKLPCEIIRARPDEDDEVRRAMQSMSISDRGPSNPVVYAMQQSDRQFLKGNFPRSLKYIQWALAAAGNKYGWLGRLNARIAALQAYAGDFEAAKASLSVALSYKGGRRATFQDQPYYIFNITEARAAIAEGTGDLAGAETHYRNAVASEVYSGYQPAVFTKSMLARNLMRQGRLMAAENTVRDILRTRLKDEMTAPAVIAALVRLSEILYEQGRYGDAVTLARAAVRLYEAICTEPESLNVIAAHNLIGRSLFAEGKWKEALAQYEAIQASMKKDPDSFERLFAGDTYRALTLLTAGRNEEAARSLEKAFERSRDRLGDKHYKTAEIQGFLAVARLAQGDRAGALEGFSAAAKVLLTRSREADDDSSTLKAREKRTALIFDAYIGLLADIRGTAEESAAGLDAVQETFRLAAAASSRSVERALSSSGARATLQNPALTELARREQDTQKQIAALYGNLANAMSRPFHEQNLTMIGKLRVTIDQLRGARAALMEEIERRFPAYAQLINPKPVTIEAARAILAPGEALISTYVGQDRSYVWAVPRQGAVAFAAVELGREELSDQVALLRSALEPAATTLGDIPAFDLGAAHGLYAKLLEPVKAGWGEANSLLIVAHGPLGYLPLSILPTEASGLGPERQPLFAKYRDVPWLARTHAVTMLPSVASLKTLRGLPPGDDKRLAFAGFGDPWFSAEQAANAAKPEAKPRQVAALASRGIKTRGLRLRAVPKTTGMDSAELALLPRLPDTADEVRSIAVALRADLAGSVFTGRDANEGQIKSLDLSGYKVLAFATHGLVPGDLDGLTQPALALTSPEVSGGKDDGLLTMGEILGLKLNADWVVLSACNTGSGQGAGAEAVSGLGRAFFYAGTRALLVSNWPVETTSAKALTTDLFRRQAGDPTLTRAEALRQAMVGLIDGQGFVDEASGKVVFAYAHPLFWAPFSLIGDGGG